MHLPYPTPNPIAIRCGCFEKATALDRPGLVAQADGLRRDPKDRTPPIGDLCALVWQHPRTQSQGRAIQRKVRLSVTAFITATALPKLSLKVSS